MHMPHGKRCEEECIQIIKTQHYGEEDVPQWSNSFLAVSGALL